MSNPIEDQLQNSQALQNQIDHLKELMLNAHWDVEKRVANSNADSMDATKVWKDRILNKDPNVLDNALRDLAKDTGGKMKIFLHGPYNDNRLDVPKLSIGVLENSEHLAKVYHHIMSLYPMIKDTNNAVRMHVEIPDPNDLVSFELNVNPNERTYQIVEQCKGREKVMSSAQSFWDLLQQVHTMVHQRQYVVPSFSF